MDLSGRRILLAGGHGLIGRALRTSLEAAGADVIVVELPKAAAAAPDNTIACDISDPDAVRAVFESVAADGPIDGVVNATYPRGPNYGAPFEDVDAADFAETVSRQAASYFAISQIALEFLRLAGRGSIVNIGSIYGFFPPRFEVYGDTAMTMPVEYAVSKSGLRHFTRYLAKRALPSGVRVNVVSPGGIADGTQDPAFVERYNAHCNGTGMMDPDAVCGAVLFLLSDGSRHVTGQDLVVDDGFTL